MSKRKVLVELDVVTIDRLDAMRRNVHMTRSALIRNAIFDYLEKIDAAKRDNELKEAYIANSDLAQRLANDDFPTQPTPDEVTS